MRLSLWSKSSLRQAPRAIVFLHLDTHHRALNLDPLLLYEEAAGKAPDIFFYNGMKDPSDAEYVACKHGGKFQSNTCERATEIADELQVFLTLCSQEAQPEVMAHGN